MRKQRINSPRAWAEENREIRSRANQGYKDKLCQAVCCQGCLPLVLTSKWHLLPPEMGMEQDCCPPSPISQCALLASSQVWGSGCCWIPSSYPSLPSTLQGPLSEGILPTHFGVTRVRRKRLPNDSRGKGRKAAIQTTASLPSRARIMPEDSHHYVGIPGHHKTPHISHKKLISSRGAPCPAQAG